MVKYTYVICHQLVSRNPIDNYIVSTLSTELYTSYTRMGVLRIAIFFASIDFAKAVSDPTKKTIRVYCEMDQAIDFCSIIILRFVA
jgi:hypothetical protein